MQLVIPDWPHLPANIGACCTTRRGGVSLAPFDDDSGGGGMNVGSHVGDDPAAVLENRSRLQRLLPSAPVWLKQVHGVVVLDAGWHVSAPQSGNEPQADASFASQPGVVCAIQTADCLPVLFCDKAGRVVAGAHAGWRGLAAGVLQRTVQAMRAAGAGEVMAWLGPAIGPQQFEVGSDVCDAFAALLATSATPGTCFVPHPRHAGKYLADIYQLARLALAEVDVIDVAGGGYCTVSSPQRFYSYRRDQRTGRMVSCIWIK